MRSAHRDEAALQAYLDGQLGWLERLSCVRHLRTCGACRDRLAEKRRAAARAAELLSRLDLPVDTAEGWARLRAISAPSPRRRPVRRRVALLAGACVLALGFLVFLRARQDAGNPLPTIAAEAPARLLDLCCWDLDGGGPGDDGLMTVALPGERVVGVTIYEDTNRSGDLSGEDRIRFGLVEVLLSLQKEPADSSRTIVRDICCADIDGGERADDGLYTINRPGEVIDQVILYEDLDRSGSYTPADLVRWMGRLGPAPR